MYNKKIIYQNCSLKLKPNWYFYVQIGLVQNFKKVDFGSILSFIQNRINPIHGHLYPLAWIWIKDLAEKKEKKIEKFPLFKFSLYRILFFPLQISFQILDPNIVELWSLLEHQTRLEGTVVNCHHPIIVAIRDVHASGV